MFLLFRVLIVNDLLFYFYTQLIQFLLLFQHHISMTQEAVGKVRDTFEKEYGTADVNIQDGTINYPQENGEVNKED